MAGDNAVTVDLLAVESEIATAVCDKAVEFYKAPIIEEQIEPLSRAQLAFVVLRLET
jgi:hypothetical protein